MALGAVYLVSVVAWYCWLYHLHPPVLSKLPPLAATTVCDLALLLLIGNASHTTGMVLTVALLLALSVAIIGALSFSATNLGSFCKYSSLMLSGYFVHALGCAAALFLGFVFYFLLSAQLPSWTLEISYLS